jgi:hypothetical protein
MATETGVSSVATAQELYQVQPTKAKPVKWWALAGCFWLALTAYAWSDWLIQGHAHPTPKGPTPVPTWMKVAVHSWEAVALIVLILVIHHNIIKPWRRDRRFTFDGLFIIALLSVWMIQDPLGNYTAQWANYNSEFVNLGCPQCHVPGWQSHGGHLLTEPLLFAWAAYGGVTFLWVAALNWAMRRARQRWPSLGVFGLFMVALIACAVLDIVLELAWLRTGVYHYGGSIRSVTLFAGHYYQFPLYEAVLAALFFSVWAALRFFKNDKGQSVAERGIDEVRATAKQRTGLRLLALIGVLNTSAFFFISVPYNWLGTHADNFPEDVLNRSYLTNMMCGPGTDYACPGRRVPIVVGRDSAHATPQGTLVAPKGLPVQVSEAK